MPPGAAGDPGQEEQAAFRRLERSTPSPSSSRSGSTGLSAIRVIRLPLVTDLFPTGQQTVIQTSTLDCGYCPGAGRAPQKAHLGQVPQGAFPRPCPHSSTGSWARRPPTSRHRHLTRSIDWPSPRVVRSRSWADLHSAPPAARSSSRPDGHAGVGGSAVGYSASQDRGIVNSCGCRSDDDAATSWTWSGLLTIARPGARRAGQVEVRHLREDVDGWSVHGSDGTTEDVLARDLPAKQDALDLTSRWRAAGPAGDGPWPWLSYGRYGLLKPSPWSATIPRPPLRVTGW
jgi:hypothetical protein